MAEDNPSSRLLDMAVSESGLPFEGEALLERLRRVRSGLDHERAQAPELVAELLSLPAARRKDELCRERRYHTWGVCELLLARASEAADPADAQHLAALSLVGAEHLDPVRYACAVVEDLKACAWAAAGNARRSRGDLGEAEQALRAAASCLALGTGDLLVEARLLEFESSLRREQGRTGEAAVLLKMAAARYRETGEEQLLLRALADREVILREGPAELSCSSAGTDTACRSSP
jgi:hypothetical protein